jgi:hypothetical protein
MPIVVLIVSTLLFWGIYWFVRMGGIDHFRERSQQRRMVRARASEHIAPLRAIDDPRDAATVLMLLIPRGRDPTAAQLTAIQATMQKVFGFDHELSERLTQARFIASRAQSFGQVAGIFAKLFNERLTLEERRELVGLVQEIARIDGPSATQASEIDDLERLLGLATVA